MITSTSAALRCSTSAHIAEEQHRWPAGEEEQRRGGMGRKLLGEEEKAGSCHVKRKEASSLGGSILLTLVAQLGSPIAYLKAQLNRPIWTSTLIWPYQAVAYIEASAVIYQDGKILIEVDHLQGLTTTPYLQIKGTNKEIVSSTGSALSLDGSYTTKSYLQIILESLPAAGMNNQQAARLQELVEFIQSQGGSFNSDVSSPMREISSTDSVLDDMQSRIRKLERWNTINMVISNFSANVIF
ncbi:hypothetical protein PR202_gb25728 [Eleusine coracana subsp. coracana]|uniref:Uncharacterized protein n=1 Tax=Eleusine coracana subsp. coracana TaxID=191504 RepID=A0AAV5FQ07_ELECO|nr:hypothetical protein PR202_gb25728 [Eleusine coracana subsp. coracana]